MSLPQLEIISSHPSEGEKKLFIMLLEIFFIHLLNNKQIEVEKFAASVYYSCSIPKSICDPHREKMT